MHPSADAVTQHVHKSDTTDSNTLCQKYKIYNKIKMAAIASTLIAHVNGHANKTRRSRKPINICQVSMHLTKKKGFIQMDKT